MCKQAGLTVVVLALFLPLAATAATTHATFDVTRTVFPCPTHTYTVTSCAIKEVMQETPTRSRARPGWRP